MWQWFGRRIGDRISIGRIGETAAARFLESRGHTIIERNYRNRRGRQVGEIDIISREGECLVFTEVKTRISRGKEATHPEEAISPGKLRRMERTAAEYLRSQGLVSSSYRFDGISVRLKEDRSVEGMDHLPSIFF